MELPDELRAPTPRDPATAKALLSKSRATARGALLGGLAIVPLMIGLMWVEFGTVDAVSIGLSLGVGEVDVREGETVPALERNGVLAIYTPKLGTIAARLQ